MILPRPADRGIVVFRVLPSLAYPVRLAAALLLIAGGCAVQLATQRLLPGLVAVLLGNLLLLVKGYDNRVDARGFDAAAEWERVDFARLEQLEVMHKKMKRWDRSALDATNPLGVVVFLLVAFPLGLGVVLLSGAGRVLAVDAAVLLIPHWVTGTRSILTRPRLLVQIGTIRDVLETNAAALARHKVIPLMLLSGGKVSIPNDVKFRVDIADHHEDFLGLYGQVSINEVQGTSYPYFYVVLVARKGYGLGAAYRRYRRPHNIVAEFDTKGEVEVLIIRQYTTENSGYYTGMATAGEIFREGLHLAEAVGVGATV
jgi:hypothetical protein